MNFKDRRWSVLVWQLYCSSPVPWWRKQAYKNRYREKSLFTRHKVRKKRGLYISTLEQTEIYTHHIHTSHHSAKQQPKGNSICGQRFQSLAAQRKGKLKYCQCPGMASWINYFLFVEFHFVLGTGVFCCLTHLFQKQRIQRFVRHNFPSLTRLKCVTWTACVE